MFPLIVWPCPYAYAQRLCPSAALFSIRFAFAILVRVYSPLPFFGTSVGVRGIMSPSLFWYLPCTVFKELWIEISSPCSADLKRCQQCVTQSDLDVKPHYSVGGNYTHLYHARALIRWIQSTRRGIHFHPLFVGLFRVKWLQQFPEKVDDMRARSSGSVDPTAACVRFSLDFT